MNIDHLNPDSEALAAQLEGDPNYRVLRAVPPPFSSMPQNGAPPQGRCIAFLDTETSSLDPQTGEILEIAVMLAFVDPDGHVLGHFGPLAWQQGPSEPLDPKVVLLTGLTNEQLEGTVIDDQAVLGLLDRADCIIAHNAAYDLAWVERRWPSLVDKAWACSCSEIDWLALGREGRGQQHLLMQHGWHASGHRAAVDVWSLYWLCQQAQADGDGGASRTHLQRLLETSAKPTVRVDAVRAPRSKKDALKARGYRWSPARRVWWRELPGEQIEREAAWFYRNGLPAFETASITARQRHR